MKILGEGISRLEDGLSPTVDGIVMIHTFLTTTCKRRLKKSCLDNVQSSENGQLGKCPWPIIQKTRGIIQVSLQAGYRLFKKLRQVVITLIQVPEAIFHL